MNKNVWILRPVLSFMVRAVSIDIFLNISNSRLLVQILITRTSRYVVFRQSIGRKQKNRKKELEELRRQRAIYTKRLSPEAYDNISNMNRGS